MNAYEKIIKTIRAESSRGSKKEIKLGTMKSATKCMMGQIELDDEDLLINETLDGELEAGDDVLIAQVSSGIYVILAKVVSL